MLIMLHNCVLELGDYCGNMLGLLVGNCECLVSMRETVCLRQGPCRILYQMATGCDRSPSVVSEHG